jgi:hypothetical protein
MLPLFLLAVTLVLFAGSAALADDENKDNAKGNMHEGTVISVTDTKLTMKAKGEDAGEHTHTLAADAKVICDGKECKLEELKPGMKVRVTTKKGDRAVAIKVEALDRNKNFEGSKDSDCK